MPKNETRITHSSTEVIQAVDFETGEIVTYKHKTECLVIIAYDSTYWCKIENNYYQFSILFFHFH